MGRLRAIIDVFSTLIILGSIVLLVVWFASDLEREYSGSVIVIDGDTVIINGNKIRLEGIDAPEISQICEKNDDTYQCGVKARSYLKSLVRQDVLRCYAWQRDKYQRLLGRCFVGKTDINGKMVRDGWAVAFGSYYGEERHARDAGIGIWAGKFIRPREWRLEQGRAAVIE
ncbi:MAG: thermonuclease family protein [Hyphomicrobiales bacterium]|nr:thermonuclease family protein [Hyphomicrobiales bacterium]